VVTIVVSVGFSTIRQRRWLENASSEGYVTVKLSSSLLVGKLGLALSTCEGRTSGTAVAADAMDSDRID
jgi:hypothetical protein